ncbi:cyclic nucleotide-gated channel beta-3-like [Ptychodera flava]|uniref:cyclic nucleotide-gated channel beta-3-like n=1 Tax=Ptychodera flava TaxID=63121 RepID=UPI00396A307B
MPKKPEHLELENLGLVQNDKDATTPTIRLTLPNVDSNIRANSNGITNPVFTFDEEDIKKTLDSVSVNIPVTPESALTVPTPGSKPNHLGSSISLSSSVDTNGFLSPIPNGHTSPVNGHLSPSVKQRNRCNTLSVTDTLVPPSLAHVLAVKRHSLPVPGRVDYLTPTSSLLAPTLSNGSITYSNGDAHNRHGHKSKSQPSSPVRSKSPWERFFGGRKQRKSSAISSISGLSEFSVSGSFDGDASVNSVQSPASNRLRDLVKSVTERAKRLGKNEIQPAAPTPTPTPEPSTLAPPTPRPPPKRNRLDSFAPSSLAEDVDDLKYVGKGCCSLKLPVFFKKLKFEVQDGVIDPSGTVWLTWLNLVAIAFLYNAIVIFLRGIFPVANKDNIWIWWMFDYLCDTIYIVDILLRTRHQFILHGMFITDKKLMRLHYMTTRQFKMDLFCLLPLDLLYLKVGCYGASTFLRLPRLFKVQAYFEFAERFENKSKSAWLFRVIKTIGYMLYMIHLNTCCYYAISVWEGINSNGWVWDGNGSSYIRCCYRATKTLITIGNLPDPETTFEIFFMNVDFIIGIFVFATIIGQMRDILGAARATKEAFRRRMDNTMRLLNNWKIPEKAQKRVRMWYLYNWERGELLDEKEVMEAVPIKMQTDLAIHVHMGTLSKVSLFQDCDKMLLRDLVLKLRPVLYLPGDYICTKGEVGKEMYIVNSGIVQVMGGPDGTKVLATLHPGSVFGEISLLAMGGGNRRTADVISPGFANLFVLNKQDLQEAIVNYPEAQESLKRKAKEIMKQNDANKTDKKKKRGKSLIAESILTKRRENTPRMFDAVLQVARSSRLSHSILKGAAKRKDSEFAEYSYHSSTDSEASFNEYDEQSIISERSVTRYRRKKRSPNKKKSEKCSGHENKPSSFDSAVIVHSSPKSDTEAEVESIVSSATRKRSKKSASGKKKNRSAVWMTWTVIPC